MRVKQVRPISQNTLFKENPKVLRESNLARNTRARAALVLMLSTLLLVAMLSLSATASLPSKTASATAQETMSVSLKGEVERNGQTVSTDGLRVQPGEVITWKMEAKNVSDHATSNVRLRGPVPAGTQFVPKSVSVAGATILYSIDHGQNYSERPIVRVAKNGAMREIPAAPEIYTDVMIVFDSVASGEVKTASYQTRVR
jgi:uncharacterized repeat protein (TIGR01451 family)